MSDKKANRDTKFKNDHYKTQIVGRAKFLIIAEIFGFAIFTTVALLHAWLSSQLF